MNLRQAYDILCAYLRGEYPYHLEEALRFYMDEVDELDFELRATQRGNALLKEKLKKVTKLKEKYYHSRNKWWEEGFNAAWKHFEPEKEAEHDETT